MAYLKTPKSSALTSQQMIDSVLTEYNCLTATKYLKAEAARAGLRPSREFNPDMMLIPRGATSTSDFMAKAREGRLPFTFSVTTNNDTTHEKWAMHIIKWSDDSILIVQWSQPKDNRPLANGYVGRRVIVTWDGHPDALRRIKTRGLNIIVRQLRQIVLKQNIPTKLSPSGYPISTSKCAFALLAVQFVPNWDLVVEVRVYDPFADGFLFQKDEKASAIWIRDLSHLAREL